MRRLLLILIAAFVLGAPAAAVNPRFWITAITIGDANLHWSKQDYTSRWGKPVRFDRLENGRGSTSTSATSRSISSRATRDKIGPCATVTAFKQTYPNASAFKENGKVVAYRLGGLIFTAETAKIGDVMLATLAVSPSVALNAPERGVE